MDYELRAMYEFNSIFQTKVKLFLEKVMVVPCHCQSHSGIVEFSIGLAIIGVQGDFVSAFY